MGGKLKIFLTQEILLRLYGFVDVLEFMLNPPRSGIELKYDHIYEARRAAEKRWAKKQIWRAFYNLERGGYLIKKKIDGQDHYFLTRKGLEKMLILKTKKEQNRRAQKLKNKYLMIIFDIPERMKSTRNALRISLKEIGFKQLQKSVWQARVNLLREAVALVKFYRVDDYVKFIFAQRITKKDLQDY